jgi:Rne/Rng family ribonuclease
MSKELFVSSTPHETKLAIVEEDQLTEVYFERENEYTLAGSIYKGRVTRVLPGMQSAFVDIGLERDAFLYVSDFMEEQDSDEDIETAPVAQSRERGERQESRSREDRPDRQDRQDRYRPQQNEPVNQEPTAVFEGGEDFEPQTAAGQPAEAESAEFGDEPEGDEEGGAEAGAEDTTSGDGEGVRRWRGRRRRGRGRGRGPENPASPAQSAPQREPEIHSSKPQVAGPPEYQQVVLPGESIAKFSRQSQQPSEQSAAAAEPQASEARQSTPERRDSRDRDRGRGRDRGGWRRDREPREPRRDFRSDESFSAPPPGYTPILLPGESIAKYRGAAPAASQQAQGSSAPTTESFAAEHARSEDVRTEEVRSGVVPEHSHTGERHEFRNEIFGGEEASTQAAAEEHEPQSEFPHSYDEHVSTQQTATHHETTTSFEPEPHAEHGSVGGTVLGTNDTQTEPNTNQIEIQSEAEHAHSSTDEQDVVRHEFAPGAGHLEEETIEEEEAEPLSLSEDLDDDEFEELEEQILDRVAERAGEVAAGLQLTDAIEETVIERSAEQGYEGADAAAQPAEMENEFSEEAEGDEGEQDGEIEPDPNGRAELRAPAGTAGFQQRSTERTNFDRRRQGRGNRRGAGPRGPMRRHQPRSLPLISDLLKEGQEVLVQIAKEPIAKKGARITSHIALPGRFLVYMPTVDHIGVSRKISSEEERQRLKRIVISERENGHGGFIVRTAADHADEKELRADIQFLKSLWHEIRDRAQNSKPPALIYHDLNLVERILRDQVNQNFATIWVDTEQEYERVVRFMNRFQPALVKRVKLYTKETPLFEQFNIQEEINKALKSKVWLKSGGYIVINQTEALVAIDVNTGKYVGKTARLEDTIVKTNVDAIKEIVRQIRLRDLGGIIVIDFIDMDERRNRQKVMQALEEALRQDRAPSKVLQFNDFGLVAITRKRVKQSLERTLGSPCPYCSQTGLVKSVTTVCNEIWVEMRKMTRHFEKADVMLRVNPEVAKALKQNNGRWIQELEELTARNLIVKSDPTLHQEQFDVT